MILEAKFQQLTSPDSENAGELIQKGGPKPISVAPIKPQWQHVDLPE